MLQMSFRLSSSSETLIPFCQATRRLKLEDRKRIITTGFFHILFRPPLAIILPFYDQFMKSSLIDKKMSN
jgi:hypothetical protein